jgi:hypothetical protein
LRIKEQETRLTLQEHDDDDDDDGDDDLGQKFKFKIFFSMSSCPEILNYSWLSSRIRFEMVLLPTELENFFLSHIVRIDDIFLFYECRTIYL